MKRTSEEARDVMVECLARFESDPVEVLEIVREGIYRRLAQYPGTRSNQGYPDVLAFKDLAKDLQTAMDSLAFIKEGLDQTTNDDLNKAKKGKEYIYEKVGSEERISDYDSEC